MEKLLFFLRKNKGNCQYLWKKSYLLGNLVMYISRKNWSWLRLFGLLMDNGEVMKTWESHRRFPIYLLVILIDLCWELWKRIFLAFGDTCSFPFYYMGSDLFTLFWEIFVSFNETALWGWELKFPYTWQKGSGLLSYIRWSLDQKSLSTWKTITLGGEALVK